MKKRFSAAVITALLLCLLLPSTAAADVIWEPYGNDFYDSHKDECRYEDEAYIINGGGGNVTALDQPDGKGKISIENGEQITVLFTYDNSGESWGVFEYRKDEAGEAVSAWVKMSELVKVYDGIDFFAEHESEITEIAGDGGGSYTYFEAENGKNAVFLDISLLGRGVLRLQIKLRK